MCVFLAWPGLAWPDLAFCQREEDNAAFARDDEDLRLLGYLMFSLRF